MDDQIYEDQESRGHLGGGVDDARKNETSKTAHRQRKTVLYSSELVNPLGRRSTSDHACLRRADVWFFESPVRTIVDNLETYCDQTDEQDFGSIGSKLVKFPAVDADALIRKDVGLVAYYGSSGRAPNEVGTITAAVALATKWVATRALLNTDYSSDACPDFPWSVGF